ncbi:MAG TPA: hypothetical protein VER14_03200 [Phototrophicaceae bacterium]|nr:hypothetical protein [Phototrophicaceae bacterium]
MKKTDITLTAFLFSGVSSLIPKVISLHSMIKDNFDNIVCQNN